MLQDPYREILKSETSDLSSACEPQAYFICLLLAL